MNKSELMTYLAIFVVIASFLIGGMVGNKLYVKPVNYPENVDASEKLALDVIDKQIILAIEDRDNFTNIVGPYDEWTHEEFEEYNRRVEYVEDLKKEKESIIKNYERGYFWYGCVCCSNYSIRYHWSRWMGCKGIHHQSGRCSRENYES